MRLAFCISQESIRRKTAEAIGQELMLKGISFSIDTYARFRDLLYEVEDGAFPDAVFLYVEEAAVMGEQIARLRAAGFDGKVIVVSADEAHAVHGYAWGIDDYWVLPIDVAKAVCRLECLISTYRKACLSIRCRRAWHHLPFSHIVCAESRNSKCIVHRDNGDPLVVYCRLDELQHKLEDKRFLRSHQSYLINMDHVTEVDKEFLLTGGIRAAIRQRDLKALRERYFAYCNDRYDVHE